jgi:bifunctional non-homologous end joining protein LigD
LDLQGQKLVGRFILIRTRTESNGREQWLLLHKHDDYSVEGWDPEEHRRSVVSGRTNEEVRADPDRIWRSDLPPEQAAIVLKPEADPAAEELVAASVPDGALEQLDGLDGEGIWEIYGRELHVTNLDKVLFPARAGEDPVTKRDFLRYAASVAPMMLPYLEGRALNMHRFPNGAGTKGFWHKAVPDHAPGWLTRWNYTEAESGEGRTYLVVDEPAALIWVANFGALEWHAWTSRIDDPHQPTYALVDLDPGPSTSWEQLLVLARLHRTALEHLGVTGRAKVTGQRGIQIWIPVAPGSDFGRTRAWTEQLSRAVGAVVPDLVSWKWQVDERSGLARLDYTQNALNKTLVAPYSPRPAAGAPVSAPIEWDELEDPDLRPDGFTIRTIVPRLAEKGDLFRPVLAAEQRLPPIA